jgi:pilus assembly protein CpaF
MNRRLLELVWQHDELADLDPAARRLELRALVAQEVAPDEVAQQVAELADAIDGYGPLSAEMKDERVTDVLVNGSSEVWVERSGVLERSAARFADDDELMSLLRRLLARSRGRADWAMPIASARLADGSRLHVVLPPIAPDGPLVSIRRAPSRPLSLDDLVARSMLSPDDAAVLRTHVRGRRTIVISGATGTGKTTLLNALLGCVEASERVVTVEETPELRPACAHRVALVARDANVEGKGSIDLQTLVRAALRMRPDRIVVGEVRGPEAAAALAAMSTGHEGSLLTVHAGSPRGALQRLVSLALHEGSSGTESSLDRQVRDAVDVVVHLEREDTGRRRVVALDGVG